MQPRLISTDFDGTLVGGTWADRCAREFADALEEHRASGGLWVVNTGRSLEHAVEGLRRFGAPSAPDFLCTLERHVFRYENDWLPHGDWNTLCETDHDHLFQLAEEVFCELETLTKRRSVLSLIREENRIVGLVAQSEDHLDELIHEIEAALGLHEDFHYQRNSIYLRFCHRQYHKGSALGELCRLEGIDRAHVFAVGDHFNDIPMLDGIHAALTACPANAVTAVKSQVKNSGGFVSALPYAEGVAEALRHYMAQSRETTIAC